MALPVATEADGEEVLNIDGSDGAEYSQIPADHVSDSSESSYGPLDDLNPLDGVSASEAPMMGATHNNGRSIAHNEGSPFFQNGRSVSPAYGTGNGAPIHRRNDRNVGERDNPSAPNSSSAHINVQEGMQSSGVLQSNDPDINHIQNHATNSHDAPHDGHVVHIDGMEIHVYGPLSGLQLSTTLHHTNTGYGEEDDADDVEENERQHEVDTAMIKAKEEEQARRSAPLPPEHCEAIRNAMQSISLGGYRPEWADKIPEEQWLNRLRRK